MEYVKDRLVRETIRFMEMCQLYFFEGKISMQDYCDMTNTKINFISDIIKTEKMVVFFGKELRQRLNKIYSNDYCIYNFKKDVVGK